MPQSITPAILNAADQVENDLAALDVSTRTLLQLLRAGQNAEPPAFAPTDIANLRVWLDASDASTITLSGSAVTQWTSKDANARVFSQGNATYRPSSGLATQNSLNVVGFSTDYLRSTAAASVWTFLHDGTHHEIYAVIKSGASANPDANSYFMGTANGASDIGVRHFFGDASGSGWNDRVIAVVQRGVAGNPVTHISADDLFPSNAHAVLEMVMDPDNATAADRSIIRRNGGTASQTNAGTDAPSTSAPTYTLCIGASGSGETSGLPFVGQIAEFLVYETTLTTDERSSVRTYLADKWGITL